ncbi:unnamed protein product [Bemisia tabaci]|uniref:Pantoate--beta-alanine ligase n=1 Tax=Bemisia tabaci TaxID=7038 RepID=A0A9P0G2U9_BEMTA|nr:unnamed protein product [Bemisia tabaci]
MEVFLGALTRIHASSTFSAHGRPLANQLARILPFIGTSPPNYPKLARTTFNFTNGKFQPIRRNHVRPSSSSPSTPVTLSSIRALKARRERIAMLTTYDAIFAEAASQAGVEVLLIGDTLGMVLQGHDSTLPVTVEDIAYHTACVRRGNKGAMIVADLPFISYATVEQALGNARRLMQSGAHMVKLEGGTWVTETVRRLTENGVPVCVHMGMTPQSVNVFGGFKVQGRDPARAKELKDAALKVEAAGAAMIVLECVPWDLAEEITRAAGVPVIGIGAGPGTDGQVLVLHDMLGLPLRGFIPSFVRNFLTGTSIQAALRAYVEAVKDNSYPAPKRKDPQLRTLGTVNDVRAVVTAARRDGRRVALVPTMGGLHAGHIAMVNTARKVSDFVVTSVFVNPLQFGADEDLQRYPRTLEEDERLLADAGCDVLFAPSVEEMYPEGMEAVTRVVVPGVSEGLCGAQRPGHFDGVTTVVTKLLNMVQPDLAVFGEKDYQQLVVVRKLVRDLNLPVEIIAQPTVREPDGLAMSSRNRFLDKSQSPCLFDTLRRLASGISSGAQPGALIAKAVEDLEADGVRVDYLELRRQDTLLPAQPEDRALVLLIAVRVGTTRLIDCYPFERSGYA